MAATILYRHLQIMYSYFLSAHFNVLSTLIVSYHRVGVKLENRLEIELFSAIFIADEIRFGQ